MFTSLFLAKGIILKMFEPANLVNGILVLPFPITVFQLYMMRLIMPDRMAPSEAAPSVPGPWVMSVVWLRLRRLRQSRGPG